MSAAALLPAGAEFDSIEAGLKFGEAEGRHTAALLGRDFRLPIARMDRSLSAADAVEALAREGTAFVIAGPGVATAIPIAPVPLLRIESRSTAAAAESGRGLAATPSRAEYVKALVSVLQKRGYTRWGVEEGSAAVAETIRAAGGEIVPRAEAEVVFGGARAGENLPIAGIAPDETRALAWPVLWSPELFRYGAGELNERYEEQTGAPMDEGAWSGWIAAKLVLESVLRRKPLDEVRIDGHKGALLRFEHGHLRQPIYVKVRTEKGVEVVDA